MTQTRAILTDIEGTTSSIDFVKNVLFPYARERLPAFIETHTDDTEVQHWLHEAARLGGFVEASRNEVINLLLSWIDSDRKATPLKALQGMIWADGYASGTFRAHVYPEVAAKLRQWHDDGIALYVYSSGSIEAQELFFRYSEAGDLSALFNGYFDTETGPKREAASYTKIADAIDAAPQTILFLSDSVEELDAAKVAGLRTAWVCRTPATCPADSPHPCVTDFDAIVT